ncbi:DUF3293 domain-containing protein [Luteococcus peritonei]|uniref:DUF3293 domain-containing protein n=1 Tax=Luteococcus peritonei TaxID=88874 RepID=A0ABW4RS81_9ACTN
MYESPYPGETGPFLSDQIRVTVPQHADGPEPLRTPPTIGWEESWRSHRLRFWPDPDGLPLELSPTDGPSDGPDQVLGADQAWLLPATGGFVRPTTIQEDLAATRALHDGLSARSIAWAPATLHAADQQWAQSGALLWKVEAEQALALARRHGQATVLRWDQQGLAAVMTSEQARGDGRRLPPTAPVPMALKPAATGCPMRCGADGWCKRWGGPWTSASITAALVWEAHRRMLTESLGCSLCHGGPVARGGPSGLTDLFSPTREGGWAWGGPRSLPED